VTDQIPYKLRFGPAATVFVPGLQPDLNAPDQHPDAQQHLHQGRDPVGSGRGEQHRLAGRLRRPFQHKHIRQTADLRRQQHEAHEQHVKRQDLHRHIEAHVEHEHLAHAEQAHKSPECGGPRRKQQQATGNFSGAQHDLVRVRTADLQPQQRRRTEVAEGAQQRCQRRGGHLRRDHLGDAVPQHLAAQAQPEEHQEPRGQP
jgi:hypothetical protein